ncbi:hypothetical protein Leryth_024471 [Lithospermum erythrorhizon]|nr:hypothetical protein Leryth_024471 [Lithospermum erythrorhizon]
MTTYIGLQVFSIKIFLNLIWQRTVRRSHLRHRTSLSIHKLIFLHPKNRVEGVAKDKHGYKS